MQKVRYTKINVEYGIMKLCVALQYSPPKPTPGKRLMAFLPILSAAALRKMAVLRLAAVCAGELRVTTCVSLYKKYVKVRESYLYDKHYRT